MRYEELNQCGLDELVDRLDDVSTRRTPVGWSPDDGVLRATLERRIMDIVASAAGEAERRAAPRIHCNIPVRIRAKDQSGTGRVVHLGAGGALIATDLSLPMSTHINVRILGPSDEYGLRVRAVVAWLNEQPTGLGVSFDQQPSPAHERRLRRFIMEVIAQRA